MLFGKVEELNSLECTLLFYFAFTNYYVVVPLLFEVDAEQGVQVLTTKKSDKGGSRSSWKYSNICEETNCTHAVEENRWLEKHLQSPVQCPSIVKAEWGSHSVVTNSLTWVNKLKQFLDAYIFGLFILSNAKGMIKLDLITSRKREEEKGTF